MNLCSKLRHYTVMDNSTISSYTGPFRKNNASLNVYRKSLLILLVPYKVAIVYDTMNVNFEYSMYYICNFY